MKYKKSMLFIVLGLCIFSAYATDPASTEYVDEKIAILQAQINQILQILGSQ